MNKLIIGGQEILLLDKPITSLTQFYGSSTTLCDLLSRRLELYKFIPINVDQTYIIFENLINLLPLTLGFRPLYLYNLFFLDYACSYKTYRHLYNLPVNGQRTWGGGRSIRILKSALYNYKLRKLNKFYNWGPTTFLAELTNQLWFQQWQHEWLVSYKYQDHLPWYVKKKKKWISLNAMAERRVESFFKHPYKFKKKKHHRKKKKLNKHVITTGFHFLFTKTMLKNIN